MSIIRLLEKIVGVNGEVELKRITDHGYEFVGRTRREHDFYKRGNSYIIYDPRTDKILRQFKTR